MATNRYNLVRLAFLFAVAVAAVGVVPAVAAADEPEGGDDALERQPGDVELFVGPTGFGGQGSVAGIDGTGNLHLHDHVALTGRTSYFFVEGRMMVGIRAQMTEADLTVGAGPEIGPRVGTIDDSWGAGLVSGLRSSLEHRVGDSAILGLDAGLQYSGEYGWGFSAGLKVGMAL